MAAQSRVRVMIRPERLHLKDGANRFTATVQDSAFFGPHLRHTLSVGGQRVLVQQAGTDAPPRAGEVVQVSFDPAEARLLAA
jgi:ABC-type Fe3+/spermidine/putrescine transport system ATPase subunit